MIEEPLTYEVRPGLYYRVRLHVIDEKRGCELLTFEPMEELA